MSAKTAATKQKMNRQKIKVILALAVPAMIENILQTVVGFVDTLFVAKLGLDEVMAVGIANNILVIYMAVFMAIGIGASSLIAKSIGAGDVEMAKTASRQATILSALAGILFGMISYFFAEPLLQLMGAEPKVLKEGALYFRIVGVPSIFISLMFIFGSILRSAGDTKTPMKVSWWINLIHIGLDYILIFGFSLIPGMGVAGAAIATVIVRILGTCMLYYKIKQSPFSFSLFHKQAEPPSEYKPLILLSAPAAIERLIMP